MFGEGWERGLDGTQFGEAAIRVCSGCDSLTFSLLHPKRATVVLSEIKNGNGRQGGVKGRKREETPVSCSPLPGPTAALLYSLRPWAASREGLTVAPCAGRLQCDPSRLLARAHSLIQRLPLLHGSPGRPDGA